MGVNGNQKKSFSKYLWHNKKPKTKKDTCIKPSEVYAGTNIRQYYVTALK